MASDTDVNHIFSILDSVLVQQQPQQQQHSEGTTTSPSTSADSSIVPLKRKAGESTGSVTVNRQNPDDSAKDKRPMSQSRKGGPPSGSSSHLNSEQRTAPPSNTGAPPSSLGGAEDIDMADDGQRALPQGSEDIPERTNVSNIKLALVMCRF